MLLPFTAELKRSELDPKKRALEITEQLVSFDGKSIACDNVVAVRYGSIRIEGGFGKFGAANIHEFRLQDAQKNSLRVTFAASFGKKRKEAASNLYEKIEEALHYAVTDRLTAEMIAALKDGSPFMVGKLRFENGVVYRKKMFSGEISVSLGELSYEVADGYLVLRGLEGKVFARLAFLSAWNAIVLYYALEMM